MSIKYFTSATAIACAVALLAGSLAGCSAAATQDQSAPSSQQTTQQDTTPASQQQPAATGQQQPAATGRQQPSKGPDMTAVLTRAAEILGVAPDKFITAFENARPQGGPSDNRTQGQPPAPPSGQQQGEPPAPPTGQQGGQPPAPPSGQQPGQPGTQFITEIAIKMAAELNISADKIAAAISQAEQELGR